jgi:hypothetical protein
MVTIKRPICEYKKTPKLELINKLRDLEVEKLSIKKELEDTRLKIRYPMGDTLEYIKQNIQEKEKLLNDLNSLKEQIKELPYFIYKIKAGHIIRIPKDYRENISPNKYYKVTLEEIK